MGGKDAIYINFSHKTPGIRDGQAGDLRLVSYNPSAQQYFDEVAMTIIPKLRDLKEQWFFSLDRVWLDQMEPLLRRAHLASQNQEFLNVSQLDYWDKPVCAPRPWHAYNANKQWGEDMQGAPRMSGVGV
jgi:hypothetical protein